MCVFRVVVSLTPLLFISVFNLSSFPSSLIRLLTAVICCICCAVCSAGGCLLCVSGTLWKHMDDGQRGPISLNFKLNLHTWQIPDVVYLQYRPEVLFF